MNKTDITPSCAPRKRGRPTVAEADKSTYKSTQFCVTIRREIVEQLTPTELEHLLSAARRQFNNFVIKATEAIREVRDNQ